MTRSECSRQTSTDRPRPTARRPRRTGVGVLLAAMGVSLVAAGCGGSAEPAGVSGAGTTPSPQGAITASLGDPLATGGDGGGGPASSGGSSSGASGTGSGGGGTASATTASGRPVAQGTPDGAFPTTSATVTAPGVLATPSATATGKGDLAGLTFLIDPGHNGGNAAHTSQINRQVDIGNGHKECDTTGTETDDHYPEHAFTLDVALTMRDLLTARGATVVLTRADDTGWGPCITERAARGNEARADAAISVHADGAAASGYGFHVIRPTGVGRSSAIVTSSALLAQQIREAFASGTGEPVSTYQHAPDGIVARSDLGGLNLSTVPKVFVECANMRNAADAARLRDPAWRRRAATALVDGLVRFVLTR